MSRLLEEENLGPKSSSKHLRITCSKKMTARQVLSRAGPKIASMRHREGKGMAEPGIPFRSWLWLLHEWKCCYLIKHSQ